MAKVASTMIDLGTPCPDFSLPDTEGRTVSRDDFREQPTLLVAVLCNHCPFVKHIRHELARFAREYQPQGLAMVGISANDITTHPQDSPERMAEEAASVGYTFPYLYDETQDTAKALGAACTPDFFLYDRDRRLVCRGRFDAATPGNDEPVTGVELRAAVEALLAGRPISEDQKPAVGCNIKWTPGNEPD